MSVLETIKQSGKKLLLNDNREQTGPWPPTNIWLEETWVPAIRKAGIERFAHLHSSNIFTEMSARKTLGDNASEIAFGHFGSKRRAKK